MPAIMPTSPPHKPPTPLRRLIVPTLILLVTLSVAAPAQAPPLNLPDLGNAADTRQHAEKLRRMGQALYLELKRRDNLLTDPQIQSYLSDLGARLALHSDLPPRAMTFFALRDQSLNAFAAPGGYIGIHAGLMLKLSHESEVAAVLAHEIAHITQKHLDRSLANAATFSPQLAIGILAAALIGSQGHQLGQAALAGALGAHARRQIQFTRSYESEADRIGIRLLARAGFPARRMAETFSRLQQLDRFTADGLPDYLRTHPVDEHRVAESLNRAAQLPGNQDPDNRLFRMMQARIRLITSGNLIDLQERTAAALLGDQHVALNEADRDGLLFQAALLALALDDTAGSQRALSQLSKTGQSLLPPQLLAIEQLRAAGNHRQANRNADRLTGLYPGHPAVVLARLNRLLREQQFRQAYDLAAKTARILPSHSGIIARQSQAASALGQPLTATLLLAEHYRLEFQYRRALALLSEAEANFDDATDPITAARILAKRQQIEKLIELATLSDS